MSISKAIKVSSVAVIVVNYGTAELALSAVESVLERHYDGRTVEVHLVDNASPGDDADLFRQAHADRGWGDKVTLHLEAENHGFGRGNNVVLRYLVQRGTPPKAVFFLNPDARLRTDTIGELAEFLETHFTTAIVGCGILRPNGAPVAAAFRFPNALSEFTSAVAFGPISKIFKSHTVALPANTPQGPVDWVSGAGFMARFDALLQVDFFDPRFFLYFEEIDLMYRITQAGWSIWHVSGTEIVHEAGASTGLQSGQSKTGRLPAYWYESWRLYYTKRYGRLGAISISALRLVGWAIGNTVARLRGKRGVGPSRFYSDFRDNVIKPLILKDLL